ncbi:GNAT family N-acetyltransferase [Nocardia nepalensis]|uniref:GNAT family N-acetyltransferase n=1 Tax=Nocardia nepalensis TaxID=3375448 RepID=UPI003B673FF9
MTENGSAPWAIEPAEPGSPEAATILRLYLAEMISRYYGRPTDDAEIDRHLADGHDSEDLTPPTGLLLLARRSGEAVGCVGLRRLDAQTLELTRMFVRLDARGDGGGAALLGSAEVAARELDARTIRLTTRKDLVEARPLREARIRRDPAVRRRPAGRPLLRKEAGLNEGIALLGSRSLVKQHTLTNTSYLDGALDALEGLDGDHRGVVQRE